MDTLITVICNIVLIIGFIGWILLLIAGFKRSVWWGLGIFLVWPVCIVFAIKYWEEARVGCLMSLASSLVGAAIAAMYWDSMSALVGVMENDSSSYSASASNTTGSDRSNSSLSVQISTVDSEQESDAEPEIAPRKVPVKYAFQDTDFDFLAGQIGGRIRIVTKDGRKHEGQILGVAGDAVKIRKRASGGTIDFKVYKRDVKTVQIYEQLQQ